MFSSYSLLFFLFPHSPSKAPQVMRAVAVFAVFAVLCCFYGFFCSILFFILHYYLLWWCEYHTYIPKLINNNHHQLINYKNCVYIYLFNILLFLSSLQHHLMFSLSIKCLLPVFQLFLPYIFVNPIPFMFICF